MASLLPGDSTWEVIGISRKQWALVAAAVSLGGNVRVGLEDNFYVPSGEMASSNGELVAAATRLVELSGRKVTDPVEARRILSLPDPPPRSAGMGRHPVSNEVLAEMVANVWRVLVGVGDNIAEGDTICILKSVKMEIPVATVGGIISRMNVVEGETVQEGDVIAVIE
jgi:biotin carboxyl carrier protein